MYFAFSLILGVALLALEVLAFRGVFAVSAAWSALPRLVLWVILVFLGALSARYVGLAEYPLPLSTEPNVTGFGIPILALATKHLPTAAIDYGGPFTLPALVLDLGIAGLMPVLVVSFALWSIRK